MPLLVMQNVEGPRDLKQWFEKYIQECMYLTDLFSDFSTGLLDNGPALPDRLTGCKVACKGSADRCKDPIVVGPDTLMGDVVNIGIFFMYMVSRWGCPGQVVYVREKE